MARDVPQKERVLITCRQSAAGSSEETELPFKMLVLGDFLGVPQDEPLDERTPMAVREGTLDAVLQSAAPRLCLRVPDHLKADGGAMTVNMGFERLDDFSPDGVVRQVPELERLQALRDAYRLLKGATPDKTGFFRRLRELVPQAALRRRLLAEVGLLAEARAQGDGT